MNISVTDGSNYFRGLLLLMRQDNKVTEAEVSLMKRVGKSLGFETKFYEKAIEEILENTYIVEVPPQFSTKELAEKFIADGLSLALSDGEVHHSEEAWLRSAVEKNGIDASWFEQERAHAIDRKQLPLHLQVEHLRVQYG